MIDILFQLPRPAYTCILLQLPSPITGDQDYASHLTFWKEAHQHFVNRQRSEFRRSLRGAHLHATPIAS